MADVNLEQAAALARIHARWDGLGPWHQRDDTPWGSKVVHADFGEAHVETSLSVTPPTEKWKAEAAASAVARRDLMCRVARAIAEAPTDIAVLMGAIERLETENRTLRDIQAFGAQFTKGDNG